MWRGRQISRRTKTTMAEKGQETRWRPEKYKFKNKSTMRGAGQKQWAQIGTEAGDKK